MRLSQEERGHLRNEARKTYDEYGQVRRIYRADRTDVTVKIHLSKLRARYEELEMLLNRRERIAFGAPYYIDWSPLEPGRRNSYSASIYQRATEADAPWYRPRLRALTRARVIVSLLLVVAVLVVGLLIVDQNLGFYRVPTSSMEPTLRPDDYLVAYSSTMYQRGQVVVVRDPEDPAAYLVKRIVGLPGDVVAVRNGSLILNGGLVDEPYLQEKIGYTLTPTRVRPGEVFLLGDNRNQSYDSHIWRHGLPAEGIMGAVRRIYAPRSRIGTRISYADVFAGVAPSGELQGMKRSRVPTS